MKWIVVVAMIGSVAVTTQAEAKGCIKGAVVGGLAGHLVHHGVLGAMAGCAVGMRRAHEQERLRNERDQTPARALPPSSQPSTL